MYFCTVIFGRSLCQAIKVRACLECAGISHVLFIHTHTYYSHTQTRIYDFTQRLTVKTFQFSLLFLVHLVTSYAVASSSHQAMTPFSQSSSQAKKACITRSPFPFMLMKWHLIGLCGPEMCYSCYACLQCAIFCVSHFSFCFALCLVLHTLEGSRSR